jgi:lipopolysaccharide biosynthesis glycosyltransferase
MKNNLLATLADENYIDQAKQLFSGAYFNAGWKGDYMLLSQNIPEDKLKWFRDKGILVYKCKPLVKEKIYGTLSSVMLDKIYLFTDYFKKWQKIIYLDGDIIIRASLDGLLNVKNFAAVLDNQRILSSNFIKEEKKLTELKKKYNLSEKSFNAGFFVLNTDLIKVDTFEKLNKLISVCKNFSFKGDQPIINLFFYKNWKNLPLVYNSYPTYWMRDYEIKSEEIKGIILHFAGDKKPWDPKNPFYGEWKHNLERADFINLVKLHLPSKVWNEGEINEYSSYIKQKHKIYLQKNKINPIRQSIDRTLGLLGIYLKKNFPKIYCLLKNKNQ